MTLDKQRGYVLFDQLSAMFERLYPVVAANIPIREDGTPPYILFASFTDGRQRALTVTASAATLKDCWRAILEQTRQGAARQKTDIRWLRVDWVESVEALTGGELSQRLRATKRNYFRHGISLDRQFRTAFLETELNANAMLYGGPNTDHAVLNMANIMRYAKLRHRLEAVNITEEDTLYQFSTRAAFTASEDTDVHLIGGAGLNAGRREMGQLSCDDVLNLVERGSSFLASQVQENGRFIYGWHACFDREINAYNALRHASSIYSMIEAWEIWPDEALKSAIERGLQYLTDSLIKIVRHEGREMAVLVDADDEIKLGGNAVCLLALVKYSEVMGTDRYLPLLEKLALAMTHMHDPQTGKFVHVLNYPSLTVKEAFRIVYYDGEAVFGLLRLYSLTKDERWLQAAERAFDYFIEAKHWRAHDHWLSYSVNELTRYRPSKKYFEFGLKNFDGYLDFVTNRITTFPTLLELMMAAQQMIQRLEQDATFSYLLETVDLDEFYHALETRAHYLLNGHFWPELAMFYSNPQRIDGSFFIRHHAFRIRIDDVEHYLSGMIAYLKYLRSGRISNRMEWRAAG